MVSVTGFLRCGSRASHIIAFVFVCLHEKSATIFESGNIAGNNLERWSAAW